MTEPPPAAADPECEPARSTGSGSLIPLIVLSMPAALLGASASAASFRAQTSGGWDPAGVTVLVAIVSLAEAAGSAVAMHVPAAGLRAQTLLAAAGAMAIGLAAIVPAAFLTVVAVLAFVAGVAHPLRAAAVQRMVADDVRARAASFASACDKVIQLLTLPIAGGWRR